MHYKHLLRALDTEERETTGASQATDDSTAIPGYGCLLSIVLADEFNPQVFYDELELNKGPSLGTNFTLLCPYTIIAHYLEIDWAGTYGVDENLIRISVGLENIEVSLTCC